MTSLVETPATVRGFELDAMAHVDLGSTVATIDRGWRVRVAGGLVETTWHDRTRLDVVIPRGLVAGVHDVAAIAPDGRELLLPAALTITPDPVEVPDGITVVDVDPFGDGSAVGFVTGYGDQIYLGPNATGTSAVRMASIGGVPESLSFLFARDLTGSRASNLSTAPYVSIGYPGCDHDTPECGPDNEDLRGLFTAVVFGGTEWLIASAVRADREATYLYLTTDSDPILDFRYVDLKGPMAQGNAYGVSALAGVGDRLYVGLSGNDAQLIALTTPPSAPGLDATAGDAVDLRFDRLVGWSTGGAPRNIDAITSVAGLAYVANKNLWVRATVSSPGPVLSSCSPPLCDWSPITPSAAPYAARSSRETAKVGDLEPADRAVVQIVAFGDRIFVGRNTTAGPQLWSCQPTQAECDAGDWGLVAPNSTGDTLLTQFNDPSLTSMAMLAATPSHLYVGFDSTDGLRVFRTTAPDATTRADFAGAAGCSAGSHPATCDGYGGAGFGDPTATRIFDAKAITAAGTTSVWMTIGDGSSPLSLVRLP